MAILGHVVETDWATRWWATFLAALLLLSGFVASGSVMSGSVASGSVMSGSVMSGSVVSGLAGAAADDHDATLTVARESYTKATETYIADSFCLPDLTVHSLEIGRAHV